MKKYILFFSFALFLFISISFAETKAPIDITEMDIYDLSNAMEKGYITSEQLVTIYLERIDKYDILFNSINQLNDNALEEAKELDKERSEGKVRGRLHGIPILVKCNIDVKGIPTTGGTKALKSNYPKENAYAVEKLIDEGAIILGSTNMSELAFSASSSYSSYGYVRNVFDTDYTPYGSSGGSAVAVKAGFAAAALGTDTNSSVRLPSMGAGLVGMRPTLGFVSRSGVIPYDIERDTIGVITSSVRDNALVLEIISGTDENDSYTIDADDNKKEYDIKNTSLKGITIGVPTQYVKGSSRESGVTGLTDEEIYSMMEESISKLENSGATIVYLDSFVKSSNLSISSATYAGITMCDSFDEYIKGTTGTIRSFKQLAESSGHVQNLSGYVSGCGGHYNSKASRDKKKATYRDYVDGYFEDNELDVILYPTIKEKVFLLKESGVVSPGSSLGSVIGYPSITVPMGVASDGFTYGIEFLSLGYQEDVLYQVALGFESINKNTVHTSSLSPLNYEIPDSVITLNGLYDSVVDLDTKRYNHWIEDVLDFYSHYNDVDIESESQRLIDEFPDYSMNQKQLSILKIILVVFGILVLLFGLYVGYCYIRIRIKRYLRKHHLKLRKKKKKRKSKKK